MERDMTCGLQTLHDNLALKRGRRHVTTRKNSYLTKQSSVAGCVHRFPIKVLLMRLDSLQVYIFQPLCKVFFFGGGGGVHIPVSGGLVLWHARKNSWKMIRIRPCRSPGRGNQDLDCRVCTRASWNKLNFGKRGIVLKKIIAKMWITEKCLRIQGENVKVMSFVFIFRDSDRRCLQKARKEK